MSPPFSQSAASTRNATPSSGAASGPEAAQHQKSAFVICGNGNCKIHNLQILRAIAALSVVYKHVANGLQCEPNFGNLGVDIFFVISGFIIPYVAADSAFKFFSRRVIRIVPFYWSATVLVFGIAQFSGTLAKHIPAGAGGLFSSLFFIPHREAGVLMLPVMNLGWTLNYEMYFYTVFALSLIISKRAAPEISIFVLTTIVIISKLFLKDPVVGFYGNEIVFEFMYGMVIYRTLTITPRALPNAAQFLAWAAVLIAAAALTINDILGANDRWLSLGLPAFVLVGSCILLETVWSVFSKSKIMMLVGDSSYTLYLSHIYIVELFVILAWPHLPHSMLTKIVASASLIVITTVISVAIHIGFERPVMRALKSRLAALDASPLGAVQT
jgi:peptidoglycan/LPS O-acetylase OafA/YrhL